MHQVTFRSFNYKLPAHPTKNYYALDFKQKNKQKNKENKMQENQLKLIKYWSGLV